MAETTKKTQILKTKPVKKVATKAPEKAVTKPVKKVAVKTPEKAVTKPVKKVAVKTPEKEITKPVKKVAVKIEIKKASVNTNNTIKVIKKGDFLTNLLKNLDFIKLNFSDVFLLFKNFIHWNISKLIIFAWGAILGFIAIIPFVIILFIYSYVINIDIMQLLNGNLSGNLIYDIMGYFLLFITIAIFFIFFSYSNILLIKVNNSYIKGKKLNYKSNEYFNIKKIIKFFNLSLLNISILLIPVLIFFVLIGILFMASGSLEEISILISSGIFNYFSILSLLFVIVSILLSAYLSYRVIFSYLIFSDSNNYNDKKNALSYIKESFVKTKKINNFFKFVSLFIIFSVLILPINYFGKVLEKKDKDLNVYNMFLNLSEEQRNSISPDDLYYVETLKLDYDGLTHDEINIKIKQNNIYVILFNILDFVFLYGLFVMIISSFYRRELV